MAGPLDGIRVIEMAGIGPGPFACMLLSDLGAEVIRIDRASGGLGAGASAADVLGRGRRSIALDLKQPAAIEIVLDLVATADILIEGYRPGVMERLGLGPDVCLGRNAALIYGRMTGWGQDGPLAQAAGHDIDYIALTGALDAIGRRDSGPVVPLNLLGDFGGGSMYLVMGVLSAYIGAQRSGRGQVVDAAITDGVISLMSAIHGFRAMGLWESGRERNMLDGGAHYYDTYQCADDKWVAVGAIEPQFYRLLVQTLGIDDDSSGFEAQFDKQRWGELKEKIAVAFRHKTRDEWCELLEGTDACFAPVLSMDEAPEHPHNRARGSFVSRDGVVQSAPAPRFGGTPAQIGATPVAPGTDTARLLVQLGYDDARIRQLIADGVASEADD